MTDRNPLPHRRLAEGEKTGHRHEALDGTLYVDDSGALSLVAEPGTGVTHQEHGTVTTPARDCDVLIVQTVDEDEEIRRVVD